MLSFTANYSQILTNFEFYLKLFNAVNLKMLLHYNSFLNLKKEKSEKFNTSGMVFHYLYHKYLKIAI
ncbi:hypothetical protein GOM18_01015 [Mycoplasma hyopneumoniae]|nr:hypothetical protein [Mesomycoplasma hyopneumoniae]